MPGTQDMLQDWGQSLVQEDWCSLPGKGLTLSPGLTFRPPLSLLQGHCVGLPDLHQVLWWGWGPRPVTTHSMILFRRGTAEVSFPSRLPSRAPDVPPPVFRIFKSGRFSRMPNRPLESRPVLRAKNGNRDGSLEVKSDNSRSSGPLPQSSLAPSPY